MSTTRDRARSPLPQRRSTAAGGVVLRHRDHGAEVALLGRVNDGSGVFPKGTATAGESLGETAIRAGREEAGLHVSIVRPLAALADSLTDAGEPVHTALHSSP